MKAMLFRWDEQGGAGIRHDDDLTRADAEQALGCLACIVAHNIYLDEGPHGLEEFFERFRRATLAYIQDLERGDTCGTRIGRLPK